MFGIENVFTFVLNFFFFCIWIGNESEDHVPPNLVRILQSGRVESGTRVAIENLQTPLILEAKCDIYYVHKIVHKMAPRHAIHRPQSCPK